MMSAEEKAIGMYTERFGCAPAAVKLLAGAGSNRRYFRIVSPEGHAAAPATLIATVGADLDENCTFISLARHFAEKRLPVPEILAVSADGGGYLQQDLGDMSLFDAISQCALNGSFTSKAVWLLDQAMQMLALVQNRGAEGIEWEVCHPEAMDSRMIRWDLNYFKYCFLKQVLPDFSESRLEDEFDCLFEKLSERTHEATTFMVRDFQSRNVMISEGRPFLIDFQGGRRGPMEYDVASFLWQAKAGIPATLRNDLIDRYVGYAVAVNSGFDEMAFRNALPYFVLFRILQTLGAYGFRGLSEGKPHFLGSIPAAMANLDYHLTESGLSREFPYLAELVMRLHDAPVIKDASMRLGVGRFDGLTVTVSSFSYKRGVPTDFSGNGGGFVFDCRAVHNPGRYDQYKQLTGRDKAVKDFLEEDGEITLFLANAWGMVDASVGRYLRRGFNSLAVNFGCTGGRHRSVYSAEATARHIAAQFPEVRVVLYHREQGIIETILPSDT